LQEYLGPSSEYLGDLPKIASQKVLSLITREHRKALKGIPSPSNPWPDAIGACSDECTMSIELGIPCQHTIYRKLIAATPLTKWDIHPRWHLREPVSRDVYRRILDPKIATTLRGRPKNNPQPLPANMAVAAGSRAQNRRIPNSQPQSSQPQSSQPKRRGRPPGSRNKTTLARLAHEASQPQDSQPGKGRASSLGCGRTTGVWASGRRTQPSVRRQRSQWELSSDEETMLPTRTRSAAAGKNGSRVGRTTRSMTLSQR
jgi:hypothetical protein